MSVSRPTLGLTVVLLSAAGTTPAHYATRIPRLPNAADAHPQRYLQLQQQMSAFATTF